MKKKLLSLIVTFMVLVTGVLSVPLVSNAATTENFFPFRESSDPNSQSVTRITYDEKTTQSISKNYSNNGRTYSFVGKMQQIVLEKKATINLYILLNSVVDNQSNQGSVNFGIFSEPNADFENKIVNCTASNIGSDLKYNSCTATLNAGTYYIVLYSIRYTDSNPAKNTVSIYANYQYEKNTPPITGTPPVASKISLANLSDPKISNQRYTGRTISPSIRVTYAGKVLVKNKDYILRYSNNVNPGKASGQIVGIGNYTGVKNFTFKIVPKKATVKKVKSKKKKNLTVYWKRDSKATGYQVVIAQNKKFKKGKKTATIRKNKTTSKTFKRLKSKKKYYAKVRSYKVIDGKKYYGAYSKVKSVKVK